MPMIQVTFFSVLAKIAGTARMVVDLSSSGSLADLLLVLKNHLGDEFGEKVFNTKTMINPFVLVLVNGVDIRNNGDMNKMMDDGDRVEFLPAIAGG